MDGITFDQLQATLGDPLKGLEKGINELLKLQQFLGQKVDSFTEFQKDLAQKVSELAGYAENFIKNEDKPVDTSSDKASGSKTSEGISDIKLVSSTAKTIPSSLKVLPVRVVDIGGDKSKDKDEKGPLSGITSMFTGLFGKTKEAKSSYHHEEVNLLIPSETEVKLQNIIGDTLKPFFDRQNNKINDLFDTADSIYKLLLSQNKKGAGESWWKKLLTFLSPVGTMLKNLLFEIPKFLLGIGKQIIPLVGKLLGPLMPLLAGAGLAIAGIMTLISGIKDSGPYKGLKKLLGKGLLNSGLAIIKKEFSKLTKLGSEALAGAARSI